MGKTVDAITQEILSWPGVVAQPHRFGGVEFTIDHREIGHLHGDRLADLPFPPRIRDELITSGRARPPHVLPESGGGSRWVHGPEGEEQVLALVRLNYERVASRWRPHRP